MTEFLVRHFVKDYENVKKDSYSVSTARYESFSKKRDGKFF